MAVTVKTLVPVKDLEVGKTYRPRGSGFGPKETRKILFKSDQVVVFEREDGTQDAYGNLRWSSLTFDEVPPYFEVGKTYMYGTSDETNYLVTDVDPDGKWVSFIESTTYVKQTAAFHRYSEVKNA